MIVKYTITIGVVILLFLSCKQSLKTTSDPFSRVRIETILEDSLLNIRAIEFNNNKLMAVSSIGNRYMIDLETKDVLIDRVSTDPINFRASALVNDTFFSLSIGNPALLFKDDVLVYKETHPNVFMMPYIFGIQKKEWRLVIPSTAV